MANPKSFREGRYIGVDNDLYGGMTDVGKIIRDAKVFGLIEDDQTCENWNLQGLDALLDKVNAEWDKYGLLVSKLPEDLQERHKKIHGDAVEKARELGWDGEQEIGQD